MDVFELLENLGVDVTGIGVHKHLKLLANHKNDFALVDNGVQWVSHLMGDSGVDERKEFSLCLGGVVEDLLRNVNEAKHNSILLAIISLDVALLDLDELEFWNVLLIYILHAWQVLHDDVNVLPCRNHLG